MLEISKELYDYLDKGKRGINLRMLREQEQQNKDKKPAWRSTGVSNMPNWDKPSKYQQNSNIKAKIYTGLQGTEKKKDKAPEIDDKKENLDQEFLFDDNGNMIMQEELLADLSPSQREQVSSDKKTLYQYMLWQCNRQKNSKTSLDGENYQKQIITAL